MGQGAPETTGTLRRKRNVNCCAYTPSLPGLQEFITTWLRDESIPTVPLILPAARHFADAKSVCNNIASGGRKFNVHRWFGRDEIAFGAPTLTAPPLLARPAAALCSTGTGLQRRDGLREAEGVGGPGSRWPLSPHGGRHPS